MHDRHPFWLFAGIILLACPMFVRAQQDTPGQTRSSHLPLPRSDSNREDPEIIFELNLNRARQGAMLKRLTSEELSKLPVLLRGTSPADTREIKAMLAKLSGSKQPEFSDQQISELRRNLQAFREAHQEPASSLTPKQKEELMRFLNQHQPQSSVGPTDNPTSSSNPNRNETQGSTSPGAASLSRPNEREREKREELLRQLGPMNEQLRSHPALQEVLKGMTNNAVGSNRTSALPRNEYIGKLARHLPKPTDYVKPESLGSLGDWKNWRLQRPAWSTDWKPNRLQPGGSSNLSAPGVPSLQGSFAILGSLWPALVGLIFLLAGYIAVKSILSRRRVAGAASVPWKPGPWPVQPGAVATRAELVRAFEHLALLCFGQAARSWNHRVISARFQKNPSSENGDRRQAAERLALVYEQARYAPSNEVLPDSALAAARNDLCVLAGVHAS